MAHAESTLDPMPLMILFIVFIVAILIYNLGGVVYIAALFAAVAITASVLTSKLVFRLIGTPTKS
jgi:hypothetical protein